MNADYKKEDGKTLRDYVRHTIEERSDKVPITAGCPNGPGQCFCTGACRKIIGYRDKDPLERMRNI